MPMVPLAMLAEIFPGVLELPGRVAARTLTGYRRDTEQYLAWCTWSRERALDPQTFRAWLQAQVEQGLSANTINRRRAAVLKLVRVSAVCDALDQASAFKFGLVPPVSVSSLRARLKPRQAFTPAQIRALCHTPDATTLIGLRDRALLATMVSSGCRVSEVLSLTREQIVPYGGSWLVQVLGKGQAEHRQAPLSQEAYDWVQRWLRARAAAGVDVSWLFTAITPQARPLPRALTCCAAWIRVKKHGRASGLPHLSCHDLRRFLGTEVARKFGIRAAQKALGHARIDTTAAFYVLDTMPPGLSEGLY